MTTPHDFRVAAHNYIANGWAVFPIHAVTNLGCTCGDPECNEPGKHPATSHGHLDATKDPSLIDALWPDIIQRNIGIATGFESHLAVIDIDPRNGGDIAWEEFEKVFSQDDLDSYAVHTGGGGLHLYYYIDRSVRTIPGILRGVDLKADGGYVIAPPSLHASGGEYFHARDIVEMRLLPRPVLDIVETGNRPEGLKFSTPGAVTGVGMTADRQREILADPSSLGPGERDTFFTFSARDMRRADATFEDTVRTLASVWDRMDNPPHDYFSQDQLLAKVRRAFEQVDPAPTRENREIAQSLVQSIGSKEEVSEHYAEGWAHVWVDETPTPLAFSSTDLVPAEPRRVIVAPDDYRFPEEIWENWQGELPVPWFANDMGIAALAKLQWGHRLRYDLEREKWLFYDSDKKLWIEEADYLAYRLVFVSVLSIERIIAKDFDGDIQDKFMALALNYAGDAKIRAVLRSLSTMEGITIHHDELDSFDGRLPVKNGVLEPDSVEDVGAVFQAFEDVPFRDHTPEDLFTRHANMEYDPEASSPVWEEAVANWFPNQDVREFVQRLMGYALFGSGQEKILAIAHGNKHSGKSAFVTNVEYLFGSFASQLSSFDVTKDKRSISDDRSFNIAHLPGARLITVAETAPNMTYNTELLKLLSSGGEDPIRASFKYKDFFTFRNKGLVLIMTNHLPTNEILDQALWARIVVVPFQAYFPVGDPRRIDLHILKRLVQVESDGVLRWFLDGYEAYQRMGLALPQVIIDETERVRESEDWLSAYVMSRLEIHPDNKALCRDVYPDYVAWARDGMPNGPVSKKEFNRLLAETFRLKRSTGNAYYFHGFSLKTTPLSDLVALLPPNPPI